MGRKTLWVNFGENGRTYSISVPEGQAVFQVHRIKGGINFEANAAAMKVLSPKSYMLYMLMICRSPGKVWTLSPSLIQKHSTLSSDDLEAALQELPITAIGQPEELTRTDINSAAIPSISGNLHRCSKPYLLNSTPLFERPAENEVLNGTQVFHLKTLCEFCEFPNRKFFIVLISRIVGLLYRMPTVLEFSHR